MISEKPFSFNTNIPGSVFNPADGDKKKKKKGIKEMPTVLPKLLPIEGHHSPGSRMFD